MSYSIHLRVYQTNPARGYFSIVEQTVWNYANGGTWSEADGTRTLTMGGSGMSGVIRFMSDKGERITVVVGVHNYKCWCDVVTGLEPNETALVVNGQYYNGKRGYMREKQLTDYRVISILGMQVGANYTVADGNNLQANIIFG